MDSIHLRPDFRAYDYVNYEEGYLVFGSLETESGQRVGYISYIFPPSKETAWVKQIALKSGDLMVLCVVKRGEQIVACCNLSDEGKVNPVIIKLDENRNSIFE